MPRKKKTKLKSSYQVALQREDFGKPSEGSATDLYRHPQNVGSPESDHYRPRSTILHKPKDVVAEEDHKELVAFSRQIFSQLGHVGWAIAQKNMYAVGNAWRPQFVGQNEEWGRQAEDWLVNKWYPACDVRGEPYDFVTDLFLDAVAMDVDGDNTMALLENDSGFPQIRFLPAHFIGNPSYQRRKTIMEGPFQGRESINGVIFSNRGRPLAYNVMQGRGNTANPMSASKMQMLFEPEWNHQGRGVPRAAKSILDWSDVQDIDNFLKRGVKLDSSVGLLHYNETGEPETSESILSDTNTDADSYADDIRIQSREGGLIQYFKAGKGEKLETLKSDRPHPNTENYIQRLERRGLLAIGWFYELLDPSAIGGASVRLIQNQARTSIENRQKTIRKRARRAIIWALSKAQQNGMLPRNRRRNANGIPDWAMWDFELPAQITVDSGNEEKADRENLKLGTTTEQAIAAKKGRWWADVKRQRKNEVAQTLQDAKDLAEEFEVSFDIALKMLTERQVPATNIEVNSENQ